MSFVNDPQIWTLIGVFSAVMLGGMTLMTTLIMRSLSSAIDGLRGEFTGALTGVEGRIDAVHTRIDAVHTRIDGLEKTFDARFRAMDDKIDGLDRDVAALSKKIFGVPD